MKQLVLHPRSGEVSLHDVPPPLADPGAILVATRNSLVSTGTERAALEFGEKSLLAKARARPDLVLKVIDKARREGIVAAARQAFARLDAPTSLGYSASGVVLETNSSLGIERGIRVACAGFGIASHAELLVVPRNLAVRIPDGVSFEAATFAAVAAVPLHAVRLAQVSVGETVALVGLGLMGQLALEMLKASGVHVIAIDPREDRLAIARAHGATVAVSPLVSRELLIEQVRSATAGLGCDAIVIAAAGTDPGLLELAAAVARDRARVIALGDFPLEVPRREFYEKELSVIVSRSYGPGRYDPAYERKGLDYPPGYVRWTEQRNMAAVLSLLAAQKIAVEHVVTHRFPIDDAVHAFDVVRSKDANALGVLITYPRPDSERLVARFDAPHSTARAAPSRIGVGFVGAGSFAKEILLPAIKADRRVELRGICTARGLSGEDTLRRFGFAFATASFDEVLTDASTHAVVIATRHDQHAQLAAAAIRAGKAVFVEKPLALNHEELELVADAMRESPTAVLQVGFNRRFSVHAIAMRSFIGQSGQPKMILARVNAGAVPKDHWSEDADEGGGRMVGEGCHFFDLVSFLAESPPRSVTAVALPRRDRQPRPAEDFSATVSFADGTVGTLNYTAYGDRSSGKERIEAFAGGRSAVIDDFRTLALTTEGRTERRKARDKGHAAEMAAFLDSIRQQRSPIDFQEIRRTHEVVLAAMRSIECGDVIRIPD